MPTPCKRHKAVDADQDEARRKACLYCALDESRAALRAWQVRWDMLHYDVERADHWPLSRDILDQLEKSQPVPDVPVNPII